MAAVLNRAISKRPGHKGDHGMAGATDVPQPGSAGENHAGLVDEKRQRKTELVDRMPQLLELLCRVAPHAPIGVPEGDYLDSDTISTLLHSATFRAIFG